MDPSFTEARTDSSADGPSARPPQWSMHDEPDPGMVDSLADLFLGDGPLSPGQSTQGQTGKPQLRLVDHAADGSIDADFPELTGEAETPNTREASKHARAGEDARVEAVVLGHLPVIASAWAMQYASHRAAELNEPVALVRFAGGNVSIDVLNGRVDPAAPMTGGSGSLHLALRSAASMARIWMVRVDPAHEASLAESSDLDAITVLTGADDAAVVSCYRTLKAIDKDLRISLGEGEVFPAMRVGVMGSSTERAMAACRKIHSAVTGFLGHETLETAVLPSMQPTRSVRLFEGGCHEPVPVLIAEIRDALDSTPVAAVASQCDEVVFDEHWDDEWPTKDEVQAGRWAAEESPAPAATAGEAEQAEQAEQAGRAGRAEPHDASHDPEPLNPALLLGGLTPIGFDCPSAPRVEMAIDATGGLHLVMLDTDDASAVGELTRARCWAKSHAYLLARADARLAEPIDPVMHVLTDRAELVRTLIETNIRVHLMAHASTASHGWVVRSINS